MSLSDDLKRNRKIFEQLANIAETSPSDAPAHREVAASPQASDIVRERAPFEVPASVQPKYRSFSLENGESSVPRETGFVSRFEAPDGVDYPALSQTKTDAGRPDPLEALYFQLESEARRSSQLSREEDYL